MSDMSNTELMLALLATPFFGLVAAALVVGTVGTLSVALLRYFDER